MLHPYNYYDIYFNKTYYSVEKPTTISAVAFPKSAI